MFGKILSQAFENVIENRILLMRALLKLFVLLAILYVIQISVRNEVLSFICVVLTMGVNTLFAVTVHRILLLGPDSVPTWGLMQWTRRETFFLLHFLGLMLVALPLTLIHANPIAEPQVVSISMIGYIALCWLWGRLSLVFPAIAMDQDVSFKYSWVHTRNYQGVMFGVVIIFPVLLSIFTTILNFIPLMLKNPETYIEYFSQIKIISNIVITLATVFVIAALSVAYKEICKEIYGAPEA